MTNREAGIKVLREMMGDQAAAKLSASADSNTFGAPIAAYAIDQVFADIWTRPGLDRRSRSLVSIAIRWLSCHRNSNAWMRTSSISFNVRPFLSPAPMWMANSWG